MIVRSREDKRATADRSSWLFFPHQLSHHSHHTHSLLPSTQLHHTTTTTPVSVTSTSTNPTAAMQISNLLTIFTAVSAVSAATVSYDTGYDNGARSLTAVSCSDGANGLITKYGWQTQKQVKKFPYIGGVQAVAGWNSPSVSFFFPRPFQTLDVALTLSSVAPAGSLATRAAPSTSSPSTTPPPASTSPSTP